MLLISSALRYVCAGAKVYDFFSFALLQGKKERLYLQSLLRNGFQEVCSLKSVANFVKKLT